MVLGYKGIVQPVRVCLINVQAFAQYVRIAFGSNSAVQSNVCFVLRSDRLIDAAYSDKIRNRLS
jgi:hypothetical protein